MLPHYSLKDMRYRLFEISNTLTGYKANIDQNFPVDCVDSMTVEDRIKLAAQLEEVTHQLDTLRLTMFNLQKA